MWGFVLWGLFFISYGKYIFCEFVVFCLFFVFYCGGGGCEEGFV